MNYCPWCGSSITDYENYQFCQNCGKKVKNSISEEKLLLSKRKVDKDAFPIEIPYEEGKARWYGFIILAIIVLLSVGMVIAVFGTGENAVKRKASAVLYIETYDERGNPISTGSGFLISNRKTIVTNYHVIEGAYQIIAWTADKEASVEVNSVLACGKEIDLAILGCADSVKASPLKLINSDSVKQGDAVYAVGYPLGIANSLSDGIVSSRYEDADGMPVLQITAPVSPGNSGGPLLNRRGQVVGVVSATYVDGQNMNIAIPSATLIELLNQDNDAQSMQEFYEENYELRVVYLQGTWEGNCKVENMDATSSLPGRRYVGEHHYTLTIVGERAILTDEYQWNGFYPEGVTSEGYLYKDSFNSWKNKWVYGKYEDVFQSYVRTYEGVIQEHKGNKQLRLLIIDNQTMGVISKPSSSFLVIEPYSSPYASQHSGERVIRGKTVFEVSE